MECPKKFFFQYSIHTDEESNVSGDVESVDSLRRHLFIKEVFFYLGQDIKQDATTITEKIFNSRRVESGEIPFGVLGRVAELDFKEYLESYLLPFYSQLAVECKIYKKGKFYSEANKTLDSIIFSTPMIWNESIKADVDLFLLEGDTLYLTWMTTASSIKDKKRILAGFTTFVINQSEQIKKEIKDYFQIESIHLAPAILHFPQNNLPILSKGKLVNYEEEIFRPFWDGLFAYEYPAFPMSADKKSCEYCPVNTVCHGYHTEFVSFLEPEMDRILSETVNQFSPQKTFPEKKEKTPSKTKK